MNCRPQVTLLSQFINRHGFDVTHTTYKNINHEILLTKIRRFIVDQLKRIFFSIFSWLKLSVRQTHTQHGFNRQSNVLFVDEAEVWLKYDMKKRRHNVTYRREGCSLHSFLPSVFFPPFFQSVSREWGAAPPSSALSQTFSSKQSEETRRTLPEIPDSARHAHRVWLP